MSRITTDLFEITEFAHHTPEEVFITSIKIVAAFIILMTMNVPLTLIITFAQARWGQGQWVFVLSAAVGLLVCYAFGTAWFLIVYTRTGAITLGVVLAKCVLPFLLPDAVKLALATLLRARLYRRIPA